ncbi:MAG: TonB-dependent siderophore receptor, partial [Rhodospirillales bacterium]
FMIRGFGTANSNYTSVNGLFGIASNLRNQLEPYERVEVIKGPTALLNNNPNIRAVGGSINLVPKRAEDEPITSVTGQFMTESHLGGHADFGRRFGTDKRFGLRVNLAERGGETPIDNNSEDIRIGSVALDYRGENFRLTGDFVHQDRLINSPQVLFLSVANGVAVPKAPDANNNLEQPWAFLDSSDTYVAVGGEVDISDSVTVYAKLGHNWSTDTYVTSSGSITNGEGDTSMTVGAYPYATKTWAGETGVRGEFETGAVSHNLSAALSAYNMLGEYPSQTLQAGVASNIYSPSYISPADYSFINRSFPTSSDQESQAVAISDTIGFFDDRLNLLLGARYQTINQKSFNSTTGVQTSSYADNKISPAAGIVIEPVRDVSVYMNYMENLEPGPTAGSTLSNAGEQFAPIVSKQWEAGVKWDAKTFGVTASIFQIIQPSQTTENNTLSVGGEQRNRGLELEMFGEATKGVRLLAGLAFTEGKLTKTANGTNEGNTAVGVPEVQANLGVEWDVPGIDGLTFLGRSLYTSSSYVNAANTQEIPDWWRLDIGARYAFAAYETPLIARLNVENVLDDNYWQSAGRSFITTGAPLTALLSLTAEF